MKTLALATLLATATAGAAVPEAQRLEQMTARFAPTDLTADLSKFTPADRQVLTKLIEASQIIDAIFLRQVWSGNAPMLLALAGDLRRRRAGRVSIISGSTKGHGRASMTTSRS